MRLFKLLIPVVLCGFYFSSCTVDSTMSFNKDYSGKAETVIDMEEAIRMMSAFGGKGKEADIFGSWNSHNSKDTINQMIQKINRKLGSKGISNFDINMEEKGVMRTSFNFKSLDALNAFDHSELTGMMGKDEGKSMGNFNLGELGGGKVEYKHDGKWFSFNLNLEELGRMMDMAGKMSHGSEGEEEGKKGEEGGMAEMGGMMMGMMSESMRVKNTYRFKRKIKDVDTDLPITREKRSITIEYSIGDLLKWYEDGKSGLIRIKVK